MEKVKLKSGLKVSPIIHGHWRLKDWNYSEKELTDLIFEVINLGITTFDHADIYGDYECESIFGKVLSNNSIRDKIQIISKCGIKLISEKFPKREIKHYDYSPNHLTDSVDNSLRNLNTDYLDLLLLHRPSPLIDHEKVADTFIKLRDEGKVLHFGVSNFLPHQFKALQSFLPFELTTNQVEISPYCLEHFDNGNVDFFQQEKIKPMAWSPLAQGVLMLPQDEKSIRIFKVLEEISSLHDCRIDEVVYAWLFNHPVGILPIVGSGKLERIESAVNALSTKLTDEQWFKIYVASKDENVA